MALGQALGVLQVRGGSNKARQPNAALAHPADMKRRLTVTMAEYIALALANLRLQETLRSQSIQDPLTGLFNRRYLEETLRRELESCERNRLSLGVIVCDIDHFKQVNDSLDHNAGDAVLRALGDALASSLRGGDIPCRYGGEEFVLVLPGASLPDTYQRAEQIRETIKGRQLAYRGQAAGPVTISLGVAAFPDHGTTWETLFHAADAALYRAKAGGRDRALMAGSGAG